MESGLPFHKTGEISLNKTELNVSPSKSKKTKFQREEPKTIEAIFSNQAGSSQSDTKHKLSSRKKIKEKSCWAKCLQCILQMLDCFWEQKKPTEILLVRGEDLLQTIQTLRATQIKQSAKLLRPVHKNIKTLVLDLEGTLTFSTRQRIPDYHFKCSVSDDQTLFTKVRPGLQNFLASVSSLYEIVIFATSSQDVTNAILDKITTKNVIKHRIYRQNCISLNRIYYLKDMRLLNRDPSNVIFVDPNIATGVLQPLNYHQISYFTGDLLDCELDKLGKFLVWLSQKECVAPVYKHYEQYWNLHNQESIDQYTWTVCNSMQDCDNTAQLNQMSLQLLRPDRVPNQEPLVIDSEGTKTNRSIRSRKKETQPTCESVDIKQGLGQNKQQNQSHQSKGLQQLSNIHNSLKDSDPFDYNIKLESGKYVGGQSLKQSVEQLKYKENKSQRKQTRHRKNKSEISIMQQILHQVREEQYIKSQKI